MDATKWSRVLEWVAMRFSWSVFLVLVVAAHAAEAVEFDDQLSQTNSEAESYSAASCAKYLCPSYSTETKKYLQDGCEGDFTSYLPADGSSTGEVSVFAALVVAGCSFLGAFMVGVFLGRNHKARD
jgi:hypothetical protein